jgi:MFS family permease
MKIIAWITWPGLLAPVVAPLIGGAITTYASWRWLFLLNLPLGVVALVAAWRLVPPAPREPVQRLDVLGVVLTCTGLGSVAWTADLLSSRTASPATTVAWAVAAVVLLSAAVRHLLRAPAPLLGLRTLRVPTFRSSVEGSSLFWLPVGSVPFLLPLLFQEVFGWSPLRSGAVVLFVFVGNVGIKPATGPLLRRFGFRTVLVASTAGIAVTMGAFGLLTAATPLAVVAAVAVLSGVARSVGFTAYNTIAFTDVPPEQLRDANALATTAQQLSAALGIAAGAIALRVGGPFGGVLPRSLTDSAAHTGAFWLLGAVALLAMVSATRLHPEAGDVVRAPAPARRAR